MQYFNKNKVNFLTLLVSMFFLQSSYAQKDSSAQQNQAIQYGVRSSAYLTGYSTEYNFGLYLTLLKGKHELAIGPSVGEMPYFYFPSFLYSNPTRKLIAGFDLSYRIYPNGQGKVFDFYFQLNSMQKWGKNTSPLTISSEPELRTTKGFASELLLEQGFDIKFLKHFCFGPSIGFGAFYSKRVFEDVSTPNAFTSFTSLDYNLILRASLGVRF